MRRQGALGRAFGVCSQAAVPLAPVRSMCVSALPASWSVTGLIFGTLSHPEHHMDRLLRGCLHAMPGNNFDVGQEAHESCKDVSACAFGWLRVAYMHSSAWQRFLYKMVSCGFYELKVAVLNGIPMRPMSTFLLVILNMFSKKSGSGYLYLVRASLAVSRDLKLAMYMFVIVNIPDIPFWFWLWFLSHCTSDFCFMYFGVDMFLRCFGSLNSFKICRPVLVKCLVLMELCNWWQIVLQSMLEFILEWTFLCCLCICK
jgi:hypothetical protein